MESSLLLVFVVECSDLSRSDTIYLNYFIRTFHTKEYLSNRLIIRFVCIDGKHNYNKKIAINGIKEYKREASNNNLDCKIVYCIDTDRINNNNIKFLSDVIQYCKDNNYDLVLFNQEIENLFNVKIEGSKTDCAIRFKKHEPPKDSIDINRFMFEMDEVIDNDYSSNLEIVINRLFNKQKK